MNLKKNADALKERAKQLKSDIPAVCIAIRDKRTPFSARLLAGIAIGYALSPIDLIPDFIPVLGYLDDVIIIPALIALSLKRIPAEVWEQSKEKASSQWPDGKPEKWYYAVPVILIWLLIVWLIVRAVWF